METKINSALGLKIQSYLNSKLLSVTNFDQMMAGIDNQFELGEDGNSIIRKQSRQSVPDTVERNIQMLTKDYVNDKSFGRWVPSQPVIKATTETKTNNLI
jgi:hypothetical protein